MIKKDCLKRSKNFSCLLCTFVRIPISILTTMQIKVKIKNAKYWLEKKVLVASDVIKRPIPSNT